MTRRELAARIALVVIFVAWCAFTLFTIAHHEAWRDEADSWLMSRDRTLPEIWRIMRYAGTPMLLYVVEKPLAALGVSYAWQWLANWPFAAGVAWLVLFRTRLWIPSRVLIVCSYFFVYEFAVVTRAYAMTTFFILLVCILHARRKGGSIAIGLALFAAANATAFGLLFACAYAAVAGVEMLVEKKQRTLRVLATQAISWLGILVSLAQLLPEPKDGQGTQTHRWSYLWTAFAGSGLPAPPAGPEVRTAAATVLMLTTLWLVRKDKRAVALFALYSLALSYLFYAKHVGHLRHWGFFLVAAIAARVVACGEDGLSELDMLRLSKIDVLAWLLTALVFLAWSAEGVRMSIADDRGLFSNAKAMAQYLLDEHLDGRDIAAHSPSFTEAVLPYLRARRTFYYPGIDRVASNLNWDFALGVGSRRPFPELIERIRKHNKDAADPSRGTLFLWSAPIPAVELRRFSLHLIDIEHNPVMSTNGESFWLYGPDGSGDRLDSAP